MRLTPNKLQCVCVMTGHIGKCDRVEQWNSVDSRIRWMKLWRHRKHLLEKLTHCVFRGFVDNGKYIENNTDIHTVGINLAQLV